MDVIHLLLLAGLSVVIAALSLIALIYRGDRSRRWFGKGHVVTYFSLLGLGFIIVEITFIQKFMKIIGYPVYAFSVIIFALLFSAAFGSLFSSRLPTGRNKPWTLMPFVLAVGYGLVLQFSLDPLGSLLMRTPMMIRLAITFLLLIPLGFFLGMPFPLGIKTIKNQGRQAIAWAWGMNGLATVVGSLVASVLSILFGFNITLIGAFLCYMGAMLVFRKIENQPFLALS